MYSWLLASLEKSPLQSSKVGFIRNATLPQESQGSAKLSSGGKKKKSPPGRSMRRTAAGGHQEPGGVSFTEVKVWKTLGRPGLRRRHIGGETKQAAAAFPPPLQHISGLNHTFRSARRFRSRPSLPVSLGSAAAGFFVRCSWFRRAPGERTRGSPARLPVKATLRPGDATELHAPRGLSRCGPGGLGLQLSRLAPRGPCPGALRVVAAAFASGLLT